MLQKGYTPVTTGFEPVRESGIFSFLAIKKWNKQVSQLTIESAVLELQMHVGSSLQLFTFVCASVQRSLHYREIRATQYKNNKNTMKTIHW